MDDEELKKSTDKSSSSDEAETNNAVFTQKMRDMFLCVPDALDERKNEGKKSAQRCLFGKDSKCSTAVPGKKKQHPDTKKSLDLVSVSSCSESNASSASSDNESDVEKNVADHYRKYAIKFNKTSPYSLTQIHEILMRNDNNTINRKPKKHEKINQIFLKQERLEPNMSNKEFNKSRLHLPSYRLGDHVVPSTSFSESHAVPSTSFSDSHAVPSTSFSDSHAGPSTSSSDIHAVPSTSSSDIHAVPSTSSSDSHADPSTSSSDIHADPSTSSSDIHAVPSKNFLDNDFFLKALGIIEMLEDLNLEKFDDNSSADVNTSDFSDYETSTETTNYTHRKRKLLKKSHRHYKNDLEFKKRRVETPIRFTQLHLPIKKYSSEEDLTTHAKEELKFSSSSEAEKKNKEN